jgi:hypothetical protein
VRFKLNWLSLVATMIGFVILGFALLGIPGALFLQLTQVPLTRLGRSPIPADAAWPIALYLTLLLPLALVPACLVTRTRQTKSFWSQVLIFSSIFLLCAFIITIFVYLLFY